MDNFFENIFKPFLTNDIVVAWLAPIICSLIVASIIGLIKIVLNKRDERKIKEANQRFINSIRPYIIQGIEIPADYIIDIRNVVVQESNIKDKYIFSELDLRNKLIMDINESKYIDESSKEKLINFTYKIFKSFDFKNVDSSKESINTEPKGVLIKKFISMPFVTCIISILLMILVSVINGTSNLIDNPIFALSYLVAIVSTISFIVSIVLPIFESKVTKKRKKDSEYYYDLLLNYYLIKNKRNSKIHNVNDKENK